MRLPEVYVTDDVLIRAAEALRTSIEEGGPYDELPSLDAIRTATAVWLDTVIGRILEEPDYFLFGPYKHFPREDDHFSHVIELFAASEDDPEPLRTHDHSAILAWVRRHDDEWVWRLNFLSGGYITYRHAPDPDPIELRTRGDFTRLRATLTPSQAQE